MLKHNLLTVFTFCLLPCLWAGCGTGGYEDVLEKQRWASGAAAPAPGAPAADKLGASQQIPGTPVSIRIPRVFTSPALAEGITDARRVKPGVVTIPGLKLTYEGFIKDSTEGQMAYYCYVGVTSGPLQTIATQLHDELAKKFPGAMAGWKDVSCATPEGQTIQCRKLRVLGKQELYYKDKAGKENYPANNDGVLEIYLYEKGGQVVIVAWRLPASIEANVGLGEFSAVDGRKRQRQVTTDEVYHVPQDRVVCRAVVVRVLCGLRRGGHNPQADAVECAGD